MATTTHTHNTCPDLSLSRTWQALVANVVAALAPSESSSREVAHAATALRCNVACELVAVAANASDADALSDAAFSLWLNVLRYSQPGGLEQERTDALFETCFNRPCALLPPPDDDDDSQDALPEQAEHAAQAAAGLSSKALVVLQAYLLRAPCERRAAAAAVACRAALERLAARDEVLERLGAAESDSASSGSPSQVAQQRERAHEQTTGGEEERACAAALVVAELLLQTSGQAVLSCEAFADVLRILAAAPAEGILARFFREARCAVLARAVLVARGDAYAAFGLERLAARDPHSAATVARAALLALARQGARRTLDDLVALSRRKAASPPHRSVLAALALAAALAAGGRSADAAWDALPHVLRLWARCFFEFKRAADAAPALAGPNGDAQRALALFTLPLFLLFIFFPLLQPRPPLSLMDFSLLRYALPFL